MKKKRLILILGMSLFFSSLIFAGPNEDASITFDLDATTYGNQNLLQIPTPNQGSYIRVDVYAQDVVNLDTYEFEVLYNHTRLQYITSSPSNPITYEPNFLTINGGQALGWMVDTSTPGVLSIAYTLAGTDTLEAPEGEGLITDIVFQTLTTGNSYLSFGNVYYHDSYGTMDEITSTVVALLGGGLAPMPPADLTAFSDTVFQNAIRLNWIDPTENVDGTSLEDLAGINIYYADETYITSVNPGVETYVVQGLTIGEQYNFYVTAYDDETPVNESMPSNTAGAMLIAPMPPSDFSVYSDYTTPNSIQLTWTDPTENIDGSPLTDLNHIDVYYSDGTLIVSVNPGVETYTDDGLTDGQLYGYYLVAVADNQNQLGNGMYAFTISLFTVGGDGWAGSMLDVLVNGVVVLDDITLTSGTGPEHYAFFVDDSDSVFVDYTPAGPYPYRNAYYVYDNIGDLVVSSGLGQTVPSDVSFIAAINTVSWYAGGSPIPAPPENLYADAVSSGIIQLTWDDPTTQADGTPLDDFAGINIYANSSFIGSVDPGVETYTVSELTPGEYYSIYVTAYDNEIPVNESEHSNTSGCYNTTLLYVQPGSALDSIQVALNFCTHNDTVLVAEGTYYENINWPCGTYIPFLQQTESIHLVSESGPEVTIIDGGENGSVIRIDNFWGGITIDATTIVEGFTIQNGYGSYDAGGILCMNGAAPTIIGNIITNNTSTEVDYSGGIYVHGSLPTITDNIISQNNTNGIYLRYWADATITGNTITQNSGAGIISHDFYASIPTIIDNSITQSGSSGISIPGGGVLIDNNFIADNDGLGISTSSTCGLITITDNIITSNLSGGIGGPISKSITNCVVSNNGGTGIGCGTWFSSTTITNSIISNNASDGISHSGECSIHYCDITDNIGFGVLNSSGGCFPQRITAAQNNWWGDPGGPFGPNGDGVGCSYLPIDYIHYTPWLTEPSILKIVSVPDFSCGEPGETISIPVNTTDITGEEVVSAEFTLIYDSTIITEMDIDATGTLLSGTDWTWQYSVVGDTLFVEMSGTDELTGSGTLINLIFIVSPDAQHGQESPLHFEEFIYNEGTPIVTTQDGIFIVGQIFGAIEGIVTEATRNPIPGAVVTAQGSYFTYCDTTDANGYYLMPEALTDTYDMTVIADGYNEIGTTGVVVIGGEITLVNFAMLHPEIVVNPASIDVELPVDTNYDTNITISNPGNGPLDFYISIGEGARFVKSIEINPGEIREIPQGKPHKMSTIQQGLPRCEALRGSTQECMKTGALFGTLQLAPNPVSGRLDPGQGFPNPSSRFDEEVIHYDGEPYTSIGLTAGGTYEGAIRLTP
ncbi:MAG: right-handed parallel beta-helix repeat-containing protein, partial [Candidatus Cloacimonetes bacterium]|nr:right-handed parallel beta-helix repeat-containing protein [Candidatus Cloacimonadota bacterium]